MTTEEITKAAINYEEELTYRPKDMYDIQKAFCIPGRQIGIAGHTLKAPTIKQLCRGFLLIRVIRYMNYIELTVLRLQVKCVFL